MTWLLGRLVVVLVGCSGEEGQGPEVIADARVLREVLASDQASVALADVDRAVDEGRPYLGAERLSQGAIPATRRQMERAADVAVRSARGRELKGQLGQAYRARLSALEAYRDVLARGEQGMPLVEALRAQRTAEEALIAVHNALDAIDRPTGRSPTVPR